MFVNREVEISRLQQALSREKTQLIIVYGRRRCGKSTLLKRLLVKDSIYFSADMREMPLQIKAFSERIDGEIPGFSAPVYPGWDSVLRSLERSLKKRITVCIDEFPYLVKNAPELPSVLQNIIDDSSGSSYNLILCGSSQMMMNDMVLSRNAPLYGRAGEIMKINPMSAYYLMKYLNLTAAETVTEYSIWGGVPRYWEIRETSESLDDALSYHVINQHGLLAEEPERLFSDEIRTSVQAYTLLSLIGAGSHRLSEIAARVGKPATHLSGALSFLAEVKYIRREIPFGESLRSTKKTLYKIDDPFLRFWFTYVVPEKSRIGLGLSSQVLRGIRKGLNSFTAGIWEELCRSSVPLMIRDPEFGPAGRWWGRGRNGDPMEIDVIAESSDKKTMLIGEAKWTESVNIKYELNNLNVKIANLQFTDGRKIIPALFLKNKPHPAPPGVMIFDPEDVVCALK
ncbi:MAG: ATP-binding protein [Bacteroidales bacterium]|nr:ATP-binding protein [Bacteroidales bacterium]